MALKEISKNEIVRARGRFSSLVVIYKSYSATTPGVTRPTLLSGSRWHFSDSQ